MKHVCSKYQACKPDFVPLNLPGRLWLGPWEPYPQADPIHRHIIDLMFTEQITTVVSLGFKASPIKAYMERSDCQHDHINFMSFYLNDDKNDKSVQTMEHIIDFMVPKILQLLRSGQHIYVHCVMGISRSATLVLAVMIYHFKISVSDALILLRNVRTCVQPNSGFHNILCNFSDLC